MPTQLPDLKFEVDGKEYILRPGELSARDAIDFRGAVGVGLTEAVATMGGGDLGVLAGLIWLVRRKTERALTFDAVADSFTLGTVLDGFNVEEVNGLKAVDAGPEASAGS